jgi:type II secretory pathway component HofQ
LVNGSLLLLVPEKSIKAFDDTPEPLEENLNRRITNLDFKNTDLKDLMRLIATKYNLNIFVDENVDLKLTMHLSNVTVGDALKFILDNNNLILEEYGSIYKIAPEVTADSLPDSIFDGQIEYHDGLLSVDLQNTDIRETAYQISRISGINIILDKSISGKISGFIQDLPLPSALYHLFRSNGYYLEHKDNVMWIRPAHRTLITDSTMYSNFWVHTHDGRIDLELSGIPLNRVLTEISRQVNFGFFFTGHWRGR